MKLLNDYEFKSSYRKIVDDVAEDFYMPCMRNSITYDRISGYFSSTIYLIAWDALIEFINNGGKIRVICSPFISDADKEAIECGVKAQKDKILADAMKAEIEDLFKMNDLKNPARLLACLISQGIVEIKLAIVKHEANPHVARLYHDKAGVFSDINGNAVAFRGSFNETFKGLSNDGNIESIDVFQSWDSGKDFERLSEIRESFNNIWNEKYSSIELYSMPDEAQQLIEKEASNYKWEELLDEIQITKQKSQKWTVSKNRDALPLRKHQINALEAWEKQNYSGIFQGCTGCGKTVIAIASARKMLEKGKSVLILVPSKELLGNWEKEIRKLINDLDLKILLCGDGNNEWKKNNNLFHWTSPSEDIYKITIAIMETATNQDFLSSINQGEHLYVIADEVHRMGSQKKRLFFDIEAGARFGLSATPERFGDKEGTEAIFSYFGDVLYPPYTLEDALRDKVLTKYYYRPESVQLTEAEQEKWDEITKAISKRYARNKNNNSNPAEDSFLQMMRIERARIIKKAANKLVKAIEIIRKEFQYGQKWLVYCEDKTQMFEVNKAVLDLGIDSFVYYSEMTGDKQATLDYFAENGGILVSIKCLDEGVDIPSTTHALILASSKNPREFIQRRGRILRRAENKYYSKLFDVIAVPNVSTENDEKSLAIILGELGRAIEFGSYADNPSCIADLQLIALKYGVDYNEFINGGYEDEE